MSAVQQAKAAVEFSARFLGVLLGSACLSAAAYTKIEPKACYKGLPWPKHFVQDVLNRVRKAVIALLLTVESFGLCSAVRARIACNDNHEMMSASIRPLVRMLTQFAIKPCALNAGHKVR